MRKTVRQAARATAQLALAVGLTAFSYAFITVLLITAIGTVALVGIWLLPEAVLLIRRMAGAKRTMVADWTDRELPDAYQPITARSATGCGPRSSILARSPMRAG